MHEANIKQVIEMQEKAYAERVGQEFGDFVVKDVWFDWEQRTQLWRVECKKCGDTSIVTGTVGKDWARGNGRRQSCKKCKTEVKDERKRRSEAKKEAAELELDSFLGKEINGWIISQRQGNTFSAICECCGRSRKTTRSDIKNGIPTCRHPVDFSDPSFIGKRFGHLTVLEHIHGEFLVRCDCGAEKKVKCSVLNNGKSTTCGRIECEYHKKTMDYYGKHGEYVRQYGERAETNIQHWLEKLGYKVKRTPQSGDYGVDLIVTGKDGSLVAIQIKNNAKTHNETNVHAVQEVFAGGTFYGCNKFAVVSYTGYTDNAKKMADKLGVMLLTERCELYKPEDHLPVNTKHVWSVNGKMEPMITTFRREGWRGKPSNYVGMTYEEAKAKIQHSEEQTQKTKIMKEFNVSNGLVYYRMKKMGMTFEEAISTPKLCQGRPRKTI